jgi:hypothetical protein
MAETLNLDWGVEMQFMSMDRTKLSVHIVAIWVLTLYYLCCHENLILCVGVWGGGGIWGTLASMAMCAYIEIKLENLLYNTP